MAIDMNNISNNLIERHFVNAPASLTVAEFKRLYTLKTKADAIKADPKSNKKFSGSEARWLSALMGHTESPKKGDYKKFILANVETVYNKYAKRKVSKDRYEVKTVSLTHVFRDEATGHMCVKLSTMTDTANSANGVWRMTQKLGLVSITLDTNDGEGATPDISALNDAMYGDIVNTGLYVVDDDNNVVERFITGVHGASNMRNGVATLVSTMNAVNQKMSKMDDDEKRVYLWKALLGHKDDSRPLTDILTELHMDHNGMAKMMARLFIDTSGSYLVAEVLPQYRDLLKSARIKYFDKDENIHVPVNVLNCNNFEDHKLVVTQETCDESACNGQSAADLIYFVPATIIDGRWTLEDGIEFIDLYTKHGFSAMAALNSEDGDKFGKLYGSLKKVMQVRIQFNGTKGTIAAYCIEDVLAWYKANMDKPNMKKVYEDLKDYDAWFPVEFVKFNTGYGLEYLELCRTEAEAKGFVVDNHQFAETYYTDMSPAAKGYLDMMKKVCDGKDVKGATRSALAILNAIGDRTVDPLKEDRDTSTNPINLVERLESNYMLVQEPHTRQEFFHINDKFMPGLGVGKIPMAGGTYTIGINDFLGYLDILYGCEVKNPFSLRDDEVYLNGEVGDCVINRAPVTNSTEGQLGHCVKNDFYRYYSNVLVFSAYSGFAYRMSNGDVDGDQFSVKMGVDDISRKIIEDFKANDKGTNVCQVNDKILFGDTDKNPTLKMFKGPFNTDEEFMAAYKKFVVAVRSRSKVGIINDAFERIVAVRQHLEYLLAGAKKLGASFFFGNESTVVNGELRSYRYDKKNNVIIATHIIRRFDKKTPIYFISGNCTIADVEAALEELSYMEALASISMQKEVDSAKNLGISVKDTIIQYLSIASVPFHMVDRWVYKNKINNEKADFMKNEVRNGARMCYVSGSNLGKLNATVANILAEFKANKVMVSNSRNMGIDMLRLLTDEEKAEMARIYPLIVDLSNEYSDKVADVIKDKENAMSDPVTMAKVNQEIINKAYDISQDNNVSMFSVAAAMFILKEIRSEVRKNHDDDSKFSGYSFCWLLEDVIIKIFARDPENMMFPVNIGRNNFGKTLTMSDCWLYDNDGNKVVKVPSAHHSELTYTPMMTTHGRTVVFVNKDNKYVTKPNTGFDKFIMPVYNCEHKFEQWRNMYKAGKDILVTAVLVDNQVYLKMVDEKTDEKCGVIYHRSSNWNIIFTASAMIGHTYKLLPTKGRDGKAVVTEFSLVR